MRGKSLLLAAGLLVGLTTQKSMAQCNTIDAITTASFKITGGEACSTYANLSWSYTRNNGTMTIEWGTSTSYGSKVSVYASKPIKLTGLTSNTTYYYHVWGDYAKNGVPKVYEYTKSTFKTSGSPPANKPPAITSEATAACTTSKTVTYTITATDADNDPVTFTVSGQPSWITFASPKLTLKPVGGSANALVKLIATDGKGGADTLNLTVTVVQSTSVAEMAHMAGARTLTFGTSQIRFPASADPLVAVSLFTLGGAQIMHRNIKAERGDITMPTEGVTSGVYLLRLHNAAFSTMQRVSFRE